MIVFLSDMVVCLFSITINCDEFHLDLCPLFKSESQIQFHKSVISVVNAGACHSCGPCIGLKLKLS